MRNEIFSLVAESPIVEAIAVCIAILFPACTERVEVNVKAFPLPG